MTDQKGKDRNSNSTAKRPQAMEEPAPAPLYYTEGIDGYSSDFPPIREASPFSLPLAPAFEPPSRYLPKRGKALGTSNIINAVDSIPGAQGRKVTSDIALIMSKG